MISQLKDRLVAQAKDATAKAQQFATEQPVTTAIAVGAGIALTTILIKYLKGRK